MTSTTTLVLGDGANTGSPLAKIKLNMASQSADSIGNSRLDGDAVLVDPFNYVVSFIANLLT